MCFIRVLSGDVVSSKVIPKLVSLLLSSITTELPICVESMEISTSLYISFIGTLHLGFFLRRDPSLVGLTIGPVVFIHF